MKLPFPRSVKSWLVALVSLTAVAVVSIAPMTRPRAQSPPTTYTITDLGTLGGTQSKAFGINNCGLVAGQSAPAGTTPVRPFVWRDLDGDGVSDPGEMKDIGTLGTAPSGTANALNSFGYVVGNSPTANPPDRAFIWHDDNNDGDSDAGEMKDLMPVGISGSAEDINDSGKVVGFFFDDSGGSLGYQSFLWENDNFQSIAGTPAHNSPLAHGINNAGTIVGEDSDVLRGWILRGGVNGVFTDIGLFPTANNIGRSVAYAVSEVDQVVGTATFEPGTHAFIWTDATGLKDLGTLSGLTNSVAYNVAIVDSSVQVVGTSYIGIDGAGPSARAFVWQDADGDGQGAGDPTEMKDLTTSISPGDPTWTVLQQARSINSSGQIVGFGLKTNGETHAFLLTPTTVLPASVTVAVSPAAADEDTGALAFTFTRVGSTAGPLTVNFSVGGDALFSTDYQVTGAASFGATAGTVSFSPCESTKTVTIDPTTDFDVEPNETVVLTTTAGTGYNVGSPTSATGTINNDDTIPSVSVAVAPSSAAEDGATNLVYTFTRSTTGGSLTVNFSVGGNAEANTDYALTGASFTPPTGSVTFANGNNTATVTVNPSSDSAVESDETVILALTANANYTIGSSNAATGTIANDDTEVSVTLSQSSVIESDAPNLVYTFTRTGVTAGALTVNFSVAGTATLNDYTQSGAATFSSSAGTVTLPAGISFAMVTLDPTPDFIHEGDETVTLTVTPGTGYNIGSPSSAQGTITDDDATPTIQITNVTAPEPTSGLTHFVFTVSLTNPSSSQIDVNYVTGTAGATTPATDGAICGGGIDFVSLSPTGLTFLAGETSKLVNVTVCSDSALEPDETFFVNLSGNSANSVLPANTKGTGTITPQAPIVFTEEGNGSFAVAIDSVTFVRGPFKLTNEWNLTPSDRATRIILFTSNLGMTDANLASGILSIHIAGYGQIPLANIEHVGPITGIPGLNASYIIVKLPGELQTLNPLPGPNNLTLTVKMGSATSNATILSITP